MNLKDKDSFDHFETFYIFGRHHLDYFVRGRVIGYLKEGKGSFGNLEEAIQKRCLHENSTALKVLFSGVKMFFKELRLTAAVMEDRLQTTAAG